MYYISVIPKKQYNMETIPILKLVYDRRKRATSGKEGAVELRITYNRVQRFITTGYCCYRVEIIYRGKKYHCISNNSEAWDTLGDCDSLSEVSGYYRTGKQALMAFYDECLRKNYLGRYAY